MMYCHVDLPHINLGASLGQDSNCAAKNDEQTKERKQMYINDSYSFTRHIKEKVFEVLRD